MPIVTMAVLFASLALSVVGLQATNPYDKERLLVVVRANVLPTSEVVQAVQRRGISFQMTPQVEDEFRRAGARPELIKAMRDNYRPGSGPDRISGPLSKDEIVTMLKAGRTSEMVEQLVDKRGVSFALTPQIAREISAAGGNRTLLGAIIGKPDKPNIPPNYDELTDHAQQALDAQDSSLAEKLLLEAIAQDASRSTAYTLMGVTQLYLKKDPLAAEKSMRTAIERGGVARFDVLHDDGGVLSVKLFSRHCQGSLYVSRTGITFKAQDGRDTFEAAKAMINEAALNDNAMTGSGLAAFHLKVSHGKEKGKTYNFAPASKGISESRLILALIQGYS
jgi:hypothetical protein